MIRVWMLLISSRICTYRLVVVVGMENDVGRSTNGARIVVRGPLSA